MVPVGKNGKSTVKDLQPYRGMAYSSDSLKAHCRLKKVELEHIFHLLTVWSGRNRCWTFEATVSPLLLHDFRRTEPMADPAESPSLSSVRRGSQLAGLLGIKVASSTRAPHAACSEAARHAQGEVYEPPL